MLTRKRIDATQGPILSQILRYSFPLLLSFLIQRLFDSVDIAVLGNLADTASVAAVGSTSITKGSSSTFSTVLFPICPSSSPAL